MRQTEQTIDAIYLLWNLLQNIRIFILEAKLRPREEVRWMTALDVTAFLLVCCCAVTHTLCQQTRSAYCKQRVCTNTCANRLGSRNVGKCDEADLRAYGRCRVVFPFNFWTMTGLNVQIQEFRDFSYFFEAASFLWIIQGLVTVETPQLGGRGCDNVPVVGDVALFRARYRKVVMWWSAGERWKSGS